MPRILKLAIFSWWLLAAAAHAAEGTPTSAFREEVLSRVELLRQMQFPADQILSHLALEYSPSTAAEVRAFGDTPDRAVTEYLHRELGRRRAAGAAADVRRAERNFVSCLDEDRRLAEFRNAAVAFLKTPRGLFGATLATEHAPVDPTSLRRCLDLIPTIYAAATTAEDFATAGASWSIRDETLKALELRAEELARHPLRRTVERLRDLGRGF